MNIRLSVSDLKDKYMVRVNENNTLLNLKKSILRAYGQQPSDTNYLKVIHNLVLLEGNFSIKSYGIKDNDTIVGLFEPVKNENGQVPRLFFRLGGSDRNVSNSSNGDAIDNYNMNSQVFELFADGGNLGQIPVHNDDTDEESEDEMDICSEDEDEEMRNPVQPHAQVLSVLNLLGNMTDAINNYNELNTYCHSLSPEDSANIEIIMDATGCTRVIATQFYNAFDCNIDLAVDAILNDS